MAARRWRHHTHPTHPTLTTATTLTTTTLTTTPQVARTARTIASRVAAGELSAEQVGGTLHAHRICMCMCMYSPLHMHVHVLCVCTAGTPHAHRMHRTSSKVEAGFSSLVVTPRLTRHSSQRRFTPRTAASPPTRTCSCVRAVTYGSLTSYSTSLPTPSSSRSIASGPTLAKSSCARSLLVNQLVSASKVRLP